MSIESNTFWLLLAPVGLITFYWLWKKTRKSYAQFNVPPFPVRQWPVVGHFFMLFGDVRDKIQVWRKKAGDIYSLDLVGQLHVLFNNFDDIKEVWVKQADKIVNTQHSFGDEILDEYNTGITSARDENWKEQRSTSISILRTFGMGKNLMAEKILEEAAVINDKLASLKGQPKDVALILNASVANVISSVAVGKRFDYEDPDFLSLIQRLNTFVKYIGNMQVLTPLKQLVHLPGDLLHVKEWAKATAEITEGYSKPYVRQYQREYNENEEPQNFVTAYLREMKKKKDKKVQSNLNEKNLIAIIRTLFAAGSDTTSTTILWCLLYMLHHPRVQEKVFREIVANVGTERLPNMADKPKLTYLNAVINEVQRMAAIAPIGLRREVSESFTVRGFSIPQGSIIWPVIDSVHYDPKIWGDPENFRPERFIDENGSLLNREELIPFGIGRRVCMGEALARMELFLFLSAMFQRFRFEAENKSAELPSLKATIGTTLVPQPFQMRFIERK
ncbi:unnamed protein product [Candidula unifasciata]|uniref:Cytochrome P450 n=1 Tax=Candidula unifasciata TaxID=100452 RepID=A0A8S3ZQG2_9EUPU|nr:unnamed protein product [Candidula unifasciata]